MTTETRSIPKGPVEPYEGRRELLEWMGEQFREFGNIYRASIYGANAYVITDPEYARHVLLRNWQNFAHAFQLLGKIILELIAQRRDAGATSIDILGMLMQAKDRDTAEGMSDRQVVNEIMTLIVAGHETTASTLNWAWYLITQHPEVQEKLAAEVDSMPPGDCPSVDELERFLYTQQVLEETLRLYPALWLMTRRALRDDEIGGYFVPAGTEIYISPYFIQRHPNLWENPDRFDPERFAPGDKEKRRRMMLLPFSVGPRSCIGEYFSRLEMQLHLMMVGKRLRLRYEQTEPLEVEPGINLRSKYDFIMTTELRTAPVASPAVALIP